MSKRIIDEEMRFSIVINGNEAQKELFELERSTKKLTATNKELRAERTALSKAGKKDTEEYKALSAEIDKNSHTIHMNKKRMEALQKEIGITGLSLNQLRQRAAILGTQLRNMIPGSAEYKRIQNELKAVTSRMRELQAAARGTATGIRGMADSFNRYAAMGATFIATATGMVFSLQRMIDFNGKLSDAQADVRKTTGLSQEAVDDLTKSFGAFKTRTARVELLKLAEQAGRLGITGVKDLQDFVKAANEIKVALGDDLSEEAIQEIGKITNIYKVGEQINRDYAASLTAVGSAINEVSASGANQAGYLVDYLKRQAGIATQAKISADANIGYAATFDEIGQNVEVTATAMNKVWMDLFENTGTYAKIAGMSLEDFKSLLEKDANEAMITFLEGLNGNNEGLAVMVEKLKDLEVGGARGAQALSALSGNTELLRKRQKLAKEALEDATSVTNEYNIKNNNLAATLDKVKKSLIGAFTSETVMKSLAAIVNWFAVFIGATEDADGSITRFRDRLVLAIQVILAAVVAFVSYNAALKLTSFFLSNATGATTLYSVVNKAAAVSSGILRGATLLLAGGYNLLTGNITRATAAMRLFTRVTKLNPIGLLIGVLLSAATAFYLFRQRASEVGGALSKLNSQLEVSKEISSELSKSFAQESTRLKSAIGPLIRILENQNTSLETRKRAYEELIKIAPEFRGTVDKEYRATVKLRDVYNDILVKMQQRLRAQAQEQVLKKYYDQEAEALNKVYEARKRLESFRNENKSDPYYDLKFGDDDAKLVREYNAAVNEYNISLSNTREIERYRERQIELLTEKQKQYAEGSKEFLKIQEQINALLGNTVLPPGVNPETPITPTRVPDNKPAASETVDIKALYAERNRLRIEAMKDGFEKEKQQELLHFNERLKLLEAQKAPLEKLDEEIAAATNAGNEKLLNSLLRKREKWAEQNAVIDSQIRYETDIHLNKLGSIIEKALDEEFQEKQKAFDRETVLRETAHNNEMAALGNNEVAKKALQEKFNQEESKRQEEHLRELIAEMNAIMKSGNFEGFDLELLSPEQKQALLDFLDQANLKLSDLLNKMSSAGKGGEPSATGDFAGGVDILGMSPDQWISMFDNLDTTAGKIEAAQFAVQTMLGAWSMYSDYMNKREQIELRNWEQAQEKKKESLSRQLDAGYINQRQYNSAVEAMEKEAARKKAELEYKAAKRERAMNLAQAASGTALAVINALQTKPFVPMGLIMASVASAMGLAQMAMIATTPLPAKGYETGLYPVQREQDGKMFNAAYGGETRSGLVDKPTLFLAGERRKPEMVIDDRAWAKMDPDVKNSVYRELGRLGRVPGYEGGYYPAPRKVEDSTPGREEAIDNAPLVAVLSRAVDVLDRLETSGVSAYLVRNMENTKKIRDDLKDYDNLRNENRK